MAKPEPARPKTIVSTDEAVAETRAEEAYARPQSTRHGRRPSTSHTNEPHKLPSSAPSISTLTTSDDADADPSSTSPA